MRRSVGGGEPRCRTQRILAGGILASAACGLIVGSAPTSGLAGPLGPTVGDDDLVLVDEPGSGFVEVAPDACPSDPGGQSAQFRGPAGTLCIIVSEPMPDRELDLIVAALAEPSGQSFELPGVERGQAFVLNAGSPEQAFVANFVAGSRLVSVYLATSVPPPESFDGEAFMIDLVRRQLSGIGRPAGTDPIPTASVADPDLVALIDDLDPTIWTASEPIAEPHRVPGELVGEGEVARLLADGTNSVLQIYLSDRGAIGVSVARYRFPLFAAAALGDADVFAAADGLVPAEHRRPDLVATRRDSGALSSLAFRQGRHLFIVAPGTSDSALLDLLPAVAAGLYDDGPGGETSAFRFPTRGEAVLHSSILISGAAVALVVVRSMRSGRRRHRPPGSSSRFVDLQRPVLAVRRRARALFIAQFLMIGTALVALTVFGAPWGPLAAVVSVGGALLLTAAVRRVDRPEGVAAAAFRATLPALVLAVSALTALLAGAALLTQGARTWLFTPSLRQLQWSDRLGVEPTRLSQLGVLAGLALLALGAPVLRSARRRSRLDAQRLRSTDPRGEILYLRSFGDDTLDVPTTFSARRPFLESFTLRGREPFEECIAWQLGAFGPVVAVGEPGRSTDSLGAARELLPDDRWQVEVSELMEVAQAVVVVVGRSDGLRWEIEQVVQRGHLDKTMFVAPPVDDAEARARFARLAHVVGQSGLVVDPLLDDLPIVATISADGHLAGFSVALWDEPAYRVAVDRAFPSAAAADESAASAVTRGAQLSGRT